MWITPVSLIALDLSSCLLTTDFLPLTAQACQKLLLPLLQPHSTHDGMAEAFNLRGSLGILTSLQSAESGPHDTKIISLFRRYI